VRKPRHLQLNLGLDQDAELCGGARGCAQGLEICIVGSTLGVRSIRRVRLVFDSSLAGKGERDA
jgi:hypothetical protein